MRTFLNPQKETRRHNIWLIREIKPFQKFPTTPVSYIFQRQYGKKKRHTQLFFRVFKIFEQSYRYKFFYDITDMERTEWKLWQNIFKEFLPFSASVDELPFLTGDIFLAEDSSSDFSLPLEWYSSIDRQAPPTKIECQWNIKTLKCWCCLLLWVLEDFSRIMLLNILYLFRLGGWVSFHCKIFFIFFFYVAFMHSSIWVVI